MPKLDSNIYGADDTAYADGIAAEALSPENITDQLTADARSKGNVKDPNDEEKPEVLKHLRAGGGDDEALDASTAGGQRHRPGPKG